MRSKPERTLQATGLVCSRAEHTLHPRCVQEQNAPYTHYGGTHPTLIEQIDIKFFALQGVAFLQFLQQLNTFGINFVKVQDQGF